MKRIFVLLLVALMSASMVNAKTVRGFVSDKDGKPVAGMKMVVENADNPNRKSVAVTDEEGFFFVRVPDDMDTSNLVHVFAANGAKVIRYRETTTGLRLVVDMPAKGESVLAQK